MWNMRPERVTPNEFERALLDRIGESEPRLRDALAKLHVLSREFTGAGCFTTFRCDAAAEEERWCVGLDDLVTVPGVPSVLGAVLCCRGSQPDFLEIFTYGEARWHGTFEGFGFNAG